MAEALPEDTLAVEGLKVPVADSVLGTLVEPDVAEVEAPVVVVEVLLDADCCGPSAYTDHAWSPPPVVETACE